MRLLIITMVIRGGGGLEGSHLLSGDGGFSGVLGWNL